MEGVVLFFPVLFLSEEFGVPLLPEVTTKCVPYWGVWILLRSYSLRGVWLNDCLLTYQL